MLIKWAALVLRLHASIIFLIAAALIIQPVKVLPYLGVVSQLENSQFSWLVRCIGIVLLIPALLAPLVAAFAGERGLRQACSGMGFIHCGLAAWLLLSPTLTGLGKWSSASLSLIIGAAYFLVLRGRRRNR